MAKYRTIAKVQHVVYESMEEFKVSHPDGLVALDWRKGREGDWVLADDGSVQQVLKYGKLVSSTPREYIRTAVGTFAFWDRTRLDSKFREYIWSFGGRTPVSTKPSKRDRAFITFIILGYNPVMAYLKAFKTKNVTYAREKAYLLLGKGYIMNAIKERIEKAGIQTGATLEWAMKSIKGTVDISEDDNVKLKGADMIAGYHGAKGKENASPMDALGVFQGFGANELPEGGQKQLPPPQGTGGD